MAGRRKKLTKHLIRQVKKLLEKGAFDKQVYNALGISSSTWYNWITQAEEIRDINPKELTEKERLLVEFLDTVRKVQADVEVEVLSGILNHAKKRWQAGAWFLERRNPKLFGRDIQQDTANGLQALDRFLQGVHDIASSQGEDDEDGI